MKLSAVFEDVVDLAQRRKQKVEQAKTKEFENIDYAVAGTIDRLKSQGMSGQAAYKAVMDHLSDLVMAHDLHDEVLD